MSTRLWPGDRAPRLPLALVATSVLAALLFVLPVAMIAIGAFRDTAPGLPGGHWTTDAVVSVYTSGQARGVLIDSVLFAVVVSLVSTILAAYLAWVSTRTDTPLRSLLTPMMILVLVMPHLFFAVGWGLLGDGTIGGINKLYESLTGSESTPVNIQSWPGIVFVACLKSTALKYLLLLGPMAAMDRSQEEAAFIAGASKARTFFTVTLRALAPAIVGAFILGVIVALEYFDIPLILGGGAGIDVFATEIYDYLFERTPPQYAEASSMALGAIVLLVLLLVLQGRLLGGREFATVRGKTSRQGRWHLGRWRLVGTFTIVVYAVVTVVLPVGQLVLVSLSPFMGVYDRFSLDNYRAVLDDPQVVDAMTSTIVLAVSGGAAAVLFAVALTYVMRHNRGLPLRFLGLSIWLPWSIPGTALGLGMLWAYLSIPGLRNLYGTPALVFLGLLVAATPLAMRSVEPGVGQVSRDLEEAARIAGANRPRAFFDAVLRLVTPSLLSGAVLAAILVAGNLVIPVMLGSASSQTLPSLIFSRYSSGRAPQAASLLCLLLAGIAVAALVLGLVSRVGSRALDRYRLSRSTETVTPVSATPPIPVAGPLVTTDTHRGDP